jgi:hypothetical protein
MIDAILASIKEFLKLPKNLSKIMGNHLIRLSELLIQRIKPNKDILLSALVEANESIKNLDTVKLPEAREGALV